MQFLVLGPLEVRSDRHALAPIRRGRPRSLLHLLLIHRRVVLTVDAVADRLWERDTPRDAANAVHQLVSYLRRALGPEGRDQLVTSPVGYRLDVADDQVDAWHFDHLTHQATRHLGSDSVEGFEHALAAAEEAARLWRGDPYPESDRYEWASGDVNRLKEGYLQVQEARLEAMLNLGRHPEVALEAQSLAAAYPLREQFHAQRALALYRGGRQSEALATLRRLRHLLAEEMGLDPGQPVQALEQRILQQDPALDQHRRGVEQTRRGGAGPPRPPFATVAPGAAGQSGDEVFPLPHRPPRPPRLLGRADPLRRLAELLEPGALVTLTGVAGIGKSALAQQLARTRPEKGVWYVDLGDVDNPELAPAAIARQTGFTGQLPSDPTSVLATGFRDVTGLLVLDHCEHLLPTVPAVLDRIREEGSLLTILATSRRPLELSEEVIYRLDPLDVPPEASDHDVDELATCPSVQLFLDRARRVRSDFRLDRDTAPDVVELVRTLEGIPLAIELAAAYADVMSAALIRDRLSHHLEADAGAASRPRRQASLRAALDASSVLLRPRDAQLFDALAAFRGSFDLDAVRAVLPDEFGDPYDALASLVRQSLVTHEGGPSYRLLRPVRTYAGERLDASPERRQVLDRHATHVAALAQRASRELRTSKDALTRLQRLLPDARATMEWALANRRLEEAADVAVAYTWYWAINGLPTEGMRWLESVLGGIDGPTEEGVLDVRRHAAVLRSIGLLANPMGRVREARDLCARAIELSRSCDDEVGTTAALLTLGIAEWALGNLDAAARAHDEALSLAHRTGERWHRLSALTLRARTALDADEPHVEELLETAVAAAHDEDEQQLLSLSLSLLGRHHLSAGRTPTAEVAAERALTAARTINYREGELSALNLLGRVRLSAGQRDSAQECLMQALSVAADTHHRGALCETLESLALGAADSGRHEHAYLLLRASARERARLGLHLPSFAASAVEEAQSNSARVLGEAADLVEARVKFLKLDDLVSELLASPSAGSTRSGTPVPREKSPA